MNCDSTLVEVAVGLVGEVVGQQVPEVGAGRVGLLEDAVAVLVGQRLLVVEAPDARQRPEVVIEGAVLLHQDHHVLQAGHGPGLTVSQVIVEMANALLLITGRWRD
jgi:hypothetical protein